MLDVCGQIVAPRLFAGFDQDEGPRVRQAVSLERFQREQRGEDRVPVVGRAAAVELFPLPHGRPRSEAVAPARHGGLLVEMAIKQYGVSLASAGRRNVDEDDRRAVVETNDLERRTGR